MNQVLAPTAGVVEVSDRQLLLAFLLDGLGAKEGNIFEAVAADQAHLQKLLRHRGELITAARATVLTKSYEIIGRK